MTIKETVVGIIPEWLYKDPIKAEEGRAKEDAMTDSFGYPVPQGSPAAPENSKEDHDDTMRRSVLGKALGRILSVGAIINSGITRVESALPPDARGPMIGIRDARDVHTDRR